MIITTVVYATNVHVDVPYYKINTATLYSL